MSKRNRRELSQDHSGLHMCMIVYGYISLGLRIALLLQNTGTFPVSIFVAVWIAAVIFYLRDKRPSMRSKTAAYCFGLLMIAMPAVCAFLLDYPLWGVIGLAEGAIWLVIQKSVYAAERREKP